MCAQRPPSPDGAVSPCQLAVGLCESSVCASPQSPFSLSHPTFLYGFVRFVLPPRFMPAGMLVSIPAFSGPRAARVVSIVALVDLPCTHSYSSPRPPSTQSPPYSSIHAASPWEPEQCGPVMSTYQYTPNEFATFGPDFAESSPSASPRYDPLTCTILSLHTWHANVLCVLAGRRLACPTLQKSAGNSTSSSPI